MDEQEGDLVTPTVALTDVSVAFGGRTALHSASVDAEAGEWVAVLGPNGAGKTTLLRAVAGLVDFTGDIVVDGIDAGSARPRRLARHVTFVPQDPQLPEAMTVREYALLGRTTHVPYFGVESAHDLAVADRALATMGLDAFSQRSLATLSGGERQRVVLARALAQESPVLLLDEPTAALDLGHEYAALEAIDELRRRHRLTVMSALHDVTLAGQFADRLVVLADGRVVASGRPAEVLTEATIAAHWGVSARVIADGCGGVNVLTRRHDQVRGVVTHG